MGPLTFVFHALIYSVTTIVIEAAWGLFQRSCAVLGSDNYLRGKEIRRKYKSWNYIYIYIWGFYKQKN